MRSVFLKVADGAGEIVSEHAVGFGIRQNGSQKCTCFFIS
jgi:hypothetical protein